MKLKNNNTTYVQFEKRLYFLGVASYSNNQILMLGKFLEEFRPRDITVFKNNDEIENYDGNESTAEMKNSIVKLGIWYDADNPEYEFTLPKETFVNILQDWDKIKKQDPKLVTLYWEDDAYRFEIEA